LGLIVFGVANGYMHDGGPGGFLIIIFGFFVGLPFAIGAAAIAYWLAPVVVKHPLLSSLGVWGLINAIWFGFFDEKMAGLVLGASAAATIIFYFWGLMPFRSAKYAVPE
jgi:hypothetical protein